MSLADNLVTTLGGEKRLIWQGVDAGQQHPPARNGCVMVLDQKRDRILVHGGDGGPHPKYGFTPLNDLWAFDLSTKKWTQLKPAGQLPTARWNHSGAVDQQHGKMYVYGGAGYVDEKRVIDNDVFELDLEKLTWTRRVGHGDSPTPVQGATMTYDPSADVLVVVGGLSLIETGPSGPKNLWLFGLKTENWVEYRDVLPTTRRGHTAIYDPRSGQHIVHGGRETKVRGHFYKPGEALSDTLKISITTKK